MGVGLSQHFTYKKLLKFVMPSIAMMIVTSVYSIVDGFFVSNFAGKNAFAAVNLIMPVIMALGAFGFMIGTGGSALVAFTFGMGNKKKANEIFSMLIQLIIVGGLILSILGFIFMPMLVKLLGASSLIYQDCIVYGRILMVALVFFMLQNSFQSFLVTAERAKFGLFISILMGILNVFLDYLFVYVFRWGVAGAAIATTMAQILGGIIPLIFFIRKNNSMLSLGLTKFDWSSIRKACINGASEMLTNLSGSLVGILYNFQLMKLAAENGVAAYGVVMYVSYIFMAIYFGYAIGIGPVVGYHYGAGNQKELKNILKKSIILTLVTAVIMTAAGEFFAEPVSRIFVGYDAELLELTERAMILYSFSFLLCGFNIFGSAFFTGLNNGVVSASISIMRTLIIQVAAIVILPLLFGIDGIWCAIVVAEGITLVITILFFVSNRKKYKY